MRESDIKHEAGPYWVAKDRGAYVVYHAGITHSVSDSAYPLTNDGLSLATARCDYLERRRQERAGSSI